MFTIVLWWGVIGWCIAMTAVGYLVDCRRNTKDGIPSASHNSASPKCCECGKRFRIAEWGFITKNGLHHANCADHNTSGE